MAIPAVLTVASLAFVWLAAGGTAWVVHRRAGRSGCSAGVAVPLVIWTAAVATLYLTNSRRLMHLDSQPVTWTAVSLLTSGDFTLDEFRPAIDPILVQCVTSPAGHAYSMYPPGSTFALLPFLLLARLAGLPLTLELIDAATKLAAAVWTALSAGFLLAALRRWAPGGAWLAGLAYAFGTTAFSSAAQDLWQHGPAQAGLALALWLLTAPRPGWSQQLGLGVALGWAVLCRTTNLLPAVVLFAAGSRGDWRAGGRIALGALPFALFTGAYNHLVTGSPLLFAHSLHHGGGGFGYPLGEGLLALLFEPSRGLFVYSPFLLLAILGTAKEVGTLLHSRRILARGQSNGVVPLATVGALAAVLLLLLVGQWEEWHGGWSYGYRIVSEVALLLAPGFAIFAATSRAHPSRLWACRVLVAVSVAIHALGAWVPDPGWNAAHLHGTAYHGMWNPDPRRWQIAWHLRSAWQGIASSRGENVRFSPLVDRKKKEDKS